MEIIEAEEGKEKGLKKSKQSVRNLWETIKWTNVHILEDPEKEK